MSLNNIKPPSNIAKEGEFDDTERTLNTPQQVIESVIFSGIKRSDNKPSIYEERLLAFIILEAQKCLNGVKISEHLSDRFKDIKSLLTPEMRNRKYYSMQIPLREISGPSNNYDHVAKACENLMSKIVRLDDKTHIRLRQLIVGVDYAKDGTGNLCFDVPIDVWYAILDFSQGFRKYEIRMAAELSNPYAYLLYKFIASHKGKEGDWPVSYLREQLQLQDKYPRLGDLKDKILVPAINELDSISPITCNLKFYSSKKAKGESRRGARTRDRVKLTPIIKLGEGSHDELAYNIPGKKKSSLLPAAIVKYLRDRLLYDERSLELHAEKLIYAYDVMKDIKGGLEQYLIELAPFADKKRPDSYPKYVMHCINKKVAEIEARRKDMEQEPENVEDQNPVEPAVQVQEQDKNEEKKTRKMPLKSGKKGSEFQTVGDLLPLIWDD